ncbi:MAG: hypothetical protein AAGG48_08640 [Planctomycetota bacterium]
MPKPLVFQLGECEIHLTMNKIDRAKLYGYKDLKVLDDQDAECQLATLAGDGCTMIGKGGTGMGWVDADGCWREKSELTPVDHEGAEIEPVVSSFNEPIKLFDTVTVDEYLEHNIRLLYSMEAINEASDLMSELQRGTIFRFSYSYRGGLEPDTGFLLTNEEGEVMFAVGTAAKVDFIGMAAPAGSVESDGEESDGDMMDFDMI